MQYSVTCFLCSHLMTVHEIKNKDGYESTLCKMEGCTCRGTHMQFHTDITVLELKKTYQVDEPIKFSLKIQGYSPGGWMILSIKADGKMEEIWHTKRFSNNAPGWSAHPFDLLYEFPFDKEIIKIKNPGLYVLEISVNQHEVYEKFEVK